MEIENSRQVVLTRIFWGIHDTVIIIIGQPQCPVVGRRPYPS